MFNKIFHTNVQNHSKYELISIPKQNSQFWDIQYSFLLTKITVIERTNRSRKPHFASYGFFKIKVEKGLRYGERELLSNIRESKTTCLKQLTPFWKRIRSNVIIWSHDGMKVFMFQVKVHYPETGRPFYISWYLLWIFVFPFFLFIYFLSILCKLTSYWSIITNNYNVMALISIKYLELSWVISRQS